MSLELKGMIEKINVTRPNFDDRGRFESVSVKVSFALRLTAEEFQDIEAMGSKDEIILLSVKPEQPDLPFIQLGPPETIQMEDIENNGKTEMEKGLDHAARGNLTEGNLGAGKDKGKKPSPRPAPPQGSGVEANEGKNKKGKKKK